jgi:hypothetical protein
MTRTAAGEADRADQGLGYAVNGPYYDAVFPEHVRVSLTESLRRLVSGAGTVAEIGSGTGVFTETLLELLGPDAEIFAIEPTRIMHFSPEQRVRLWREWARALHPGGLLIMESQRPRTVTAVPSSVIPGGTLGRHRYDTFARADVVGENLIRWVMTYRTWHGDDLIREEAAELDCHVISDEMLAAELSAVGLEPHPAAPDGIQAWCRVREPWSSGPPSASCGPAGGGPTFQGLRTASSICCRWRRTQKERC